MFYFEICIQRIIKWKWNLGSGTFEERGCSVWWAVGWWFLWASPRCRWKWSKPSQFHHLQENTSQHSLLFMRYVSDVDDEHGPRCGQLLCALRHLDKSEEMRVALHLPARELKTVFFLPAVVLVGGEELVELWTERKEWLTIIIMSNWRHFASTVFLCL